MQNAETESNSRGRSGRHNGMCHILRWTPCKSLLTSVLEKNLPFAFTFDTSNAFVSSLGVCFAPLDGVCFAPLDLLTRRRSTRAQGHEMPSLKKCIL